MTLQEKELLTRFLQQLSGAQAGQKDPEAEALIRETAARQPDAAYLLVQRTIQLEQLLAASQAEVQKLQTQSQPAAGASGSSFLGDPHAWGRSAGASQTPAGSQRLGATNSQQAAGLNASRAGPASSWGSGLFGNIASTAAGVVAGSFLFQGIQSLMNGNDDKPAQTAANDQSTQEAANSSEPELLNSYDTPADGGDTLADLGGDTGGDFG